MASSFPGAMCGSLHYRVLEMDKTQALVTCNGNFEKAMSLSPESKTDLKRQVDTLPLAFNLINHGDPQIMMVTDASFPGCGCCFDTVTTGGNWTPEEAVHDINYLEMLAAYLALKSFDSTISGKHVELMVNNTTINQMGTCHSRENNCLEKQIWELCISRKVWLTVVHIPG